MRRCWRWRRPCRRRPGQRRQRRQIVVGDGAGQGRARRRVNDGDGRDITEDRRLPPPRAGCSRSLLMIGGGWGAPQGEKGGTAEESPLEGGSVGLALIGARAHAWLELALTATVVGSPECDGALRSAA